ncbi:PREDICTED: borealin isoform X1 [Gekko japonicus]|uniref:Borealin n=1 Tax=Gekko japonicus TaxID=146911 RepID=A0ABM1K9X1_GEKJA|nr:PREDICTED: borealin isoform X1 [Gekko japonicus]XP_015270509.1 PREDICTED: borealin isoform X1 [Gekko japonicus]
MAPSRRKNTRSTNKNVLKNKKLEAFLKEFDREVQARKERILMECDSFLKEIDNMYSMEFLRLPAALQEMNWLEYMLGGGEKALEKAAMVDLDLLEVTKRATEALQAPVKTVWKAKKAKQAIETIEEEDGQPVLPVGKRSRQESDPPRASESSVQKLGKAKTTAKKARRSKRGRPPPARSTRLSRRSSKGNFVTPSAREAARSAALQGATPLLTPKFDSSVFKTPGLRAPAAQERVFSISVNGSPLAATDDVFITVPGGGGETICLRAGKLSRRDLMRLNPDTLGSVKKLSAQLASLCSTIRSTK